MDSVRCPLRTCVRRACKQGHAARTRVFRGIFDCLYDFFGPQHWWPARTRWEIVVGAILTQHTAWRNVEKTIAGLNAERLLSVAALRRIPRARLVNVIRPAGTATRKAMCLKHVIRFVDQRCGGSLRRFLELPTDTLRQALLSIPGVGEETADAIALYAGHKPRFVVDAYARRIFSRLGLISLPASYQNIQQNIMRAIAPDAQRYNEFHALIVALGKTACRPRPVCQACPLMRLSVICRP